MTRHVLRPVVCNGASVLIPTQSIACETHNLTFYRLAPACPNPPPD